MHACVCLCVCVYVWQGLCDAAAHRDDNNADFPERVLQIMSPYMNYFALIHNDFFSLILRNQSELHHGPV